MSKLAPLLTEDAELVNPAGMWWRGRTTIVKALDAFHATMFSLTGCAPMVRRTSIAFFREGKSFDFQSVK